MRFRTALLASILLQGSLVFGIDTISEIKTIFLPPNYYVGDTVELRIRLKLNDPDRVITPPENLPSTDWIDFKSINVAARGSEHEVRLVFTSFAPGARTLPPLILGDVVLDDIKISTLSLYDAGNMTPRPALGQALIPGTELTFALLVVLALAIPAFAVKFKSVAAGVMERLAQRLKAEIPYKNFLKARARLEADIETLDENEFYFRLSQALKAFMSQKYDPAFAYATTAESHTLLDKVTDDEHHRKNVQFCFQYSDLIKFGHYRSTMTERRQLLRDTADTVLELDKGAP